MEDINKKIDESLENPFEIKNNFIPTKDQESISVKFDNKLDRSGKSIIENPSVPPLGTQTDISMGSEQALDNTAVPEAPVLGQLPTSIPGLEQDKK